MMGHLNSFSASGVGNLNKNFTKIQMSGGLPGGGCLSFDLTGKIMRASNGCNKVIMYILPSKQKREILFEATRTCVWLKLDVCSISVRFATQLRPKYSGLNLHTL